MSQATPASGASDAYREVCSAFVDGLQGADPRSRVPACPDWSIHDLLAHQLHQLSGCCDGTFPLTDALDALVQPTSAVRDAAWSRQQRWIDGGIAPLRAARTEQLAQQWTELVDRGPSQCLEAMLPDAAVHLFDLLGALGSTSHRDHPLVIEALDFWVRMADNRARFVGLDGLRFEVDDGPSLGSVDSRVVVGGSAFEILRTISGRRSRGQAAVRLRLPLDDNAVHHLALYGWRKTSLEE
jgi:uncharacterized protein (TIGR03083 family)